MLAEIAFLQNIYAGLDEPDALAGLITLRSQPTQEDFIVEAEAAGNWSEGTVNNLFNRCLYTRLFSLLKLQ